MAACSVAIENQNNKIFAFSKYGILILATVNLGVHSPSSQMTRVRQREDKYLGEDDTTSGWRHPRLALAPPPVPSRVHPAAGRLCKLAPAFKLPAAALRLAVTAHMKQISAWWTDACF